MHCHARPRARSSFATLLAFSGFAIAVVIPALAQQPHPKPAPKPAGPSAEVYLIRQDSSDCTDTTVNANNPSLIGGTAWVVRNPDGTTSVKVAITATPNTTYHFNLKCVQRLGDIQTYDEGTGEGLFSFPTNKAGANYAFDMYPEGAPPGNKYQSLTVKFQ